MYDIINFSPHFIIFFFPFLSPLNRWPAEGKKKKIMDDRSGCSAIIYTYTSPPTLLQVRLFFHRPRPEGVYDFTIYIIITRWLKRVLSFRNPKLCIINAFSSIDYKILEYILLIILYIHSTAAAPAMGRSGKVKCTYNVLY